MEIDLKTAEVPNGSPAVRVIGLEKLYRETQAVKDLSFSVSPGEILGLIGPNGAGKTTTLRAIAGIIPPSQGRVEIAGRDLAREPIAAKRLLAYVPDDPHLFESITVLEHFRFIASVYRVDGWREKAERLLLLFDLADKRDALGSELSRGMRQKLASACALLHQPRALLLDEPMTGLDPRGIRTMNRAILELAGGGAAVIVSSHLLAMVEKLCTRVLVLHRGQALLEGELQEIRSRFPELANDASLEEVFFRATESGPAEPAGEAGAQGAEAAGPSPPGRRERSRPAVSPALRLLILLSIRARYRRIARGLLTAKGALLMLIGLGFFSLAILGPVYTRSMPHGNFPAAVSPASDPLQRFGPAGLLAFTCLSLFASTRFRGVYFSPAEVDFLFSGPFSRRELIAYRLSTQMIHTLLSVLITSAFLFAYLRGFWQTTVGLFLAFNFINMVQIAASLVAGFLEERVVARGRRFILIFLGGLALLVFAGSTSLIRGGAEFRQALKDLVGSPGFGWALLPLKTFSETLTAHTLGGFLAWGAGAVATNLALLLLVLRLDFDYSEASLETSRRIHQRIQQAKRGGRLIISGRRLRLGVPFPRGWGGAGAVAWRQAQEMVREMPGAVYLLAALAAGTLVPMMFFAENEGLGASAAKTFGWLAAVMPFLLSNWFRFDFRGDLDRMEVLLGRPLDRAEVALGQLLVPTCLLSALQAGALGLVLAGLVEPAEREFLLYALYLCLPFNLLFVAIENFTFLLYPVRIAPAAPGDFQAMGRLLLAFVIKMAVLLVVASVGWVLGYLVQTLTGSTLLAVVAGGGFLVLVDFAAVHLVGWAFARFDVSRPAPE